MQADRYESIQDRYLQMDPEDRACLNSIIKAKSLNAYPYYSGVQWHAARVGAGAGPFTYGIALGTVVRAFSYAIDGPNAVSAGFPAAVPPTQADTNLTQASQTISGQSVGISGIAAQVLPAVNNLAGGNTLFSDSRLLAQLFSATSVEISLNGGQQTFKLGVLGMIPGAGGLMGGGIDLVGTQPIDGGRPTFDFATNGWPTHSNAFQIPEGLVWREQGRTDGMLQILLNTRRAITLFSGGTADNNLANEVAAAGIRGYTYPVELAAALMIHLKGEVVAQRSFAV